MPKIKKRTTDSTPRTAIGLSNQSETPPVSNEEEDRLESLKKVEAIISERQYQEESSIESPAIQLPKTGGIRIQTKIEILNVRELPNKNSKILFVARRGDIFIADTLEGEWLLVRAPEGSPTWGRGYVVSKYVEEVTYG